MRHHIHPWQRIRIVSIAPGRPFMKTRILLLILGIGFMPAAARADVKPHALCAEGMVLQQQSKAKIWGTADKGEKVAINFRGKKATMVADDDGRWVVAISTGDAGGPFELTIAGNNTITYKDVLVGEVWSAPGNRTWSSRSTAAMPATRKPPPPHRTTRCCACSP
jgi:hypothetical protein